MPAWWNAVQACVWIATRDETLVSRVTTTDTLFVTDESISKASLYDASHQVVMEAVLDGTPTAPTVYEVRKLLTEACAASRISMFGRVRGEGDLVAVPSHAWAHLELRDQMKLGVIAASPDTFDGAATWWDSLRVASSEVQREWPFPRRWRRNWEWDSRPDTVGERVWQQRRLRSLGAVPPTVVPLSADGLPDLPEVTLVEAWSWLAFGQALPVPFWASDADTLHADEEYRSARWQYATSLRKFKGATRARADSR